MSVREREQSVDTLDLKILIFIIRAKKMKIYVGVTHNEWFRFLSQRITRPGDEVNFWLPSAEPIRLEKGDLFLFKLHRSPETRHRDLIAGGGIFVSYSELPISLAWETFEEKNGCA